MIVDSINRREHSSVFAAPTYSHMGANVSRKASHWLLSQAAYEVEQKEWRLLPETGAGPNITGTIQTFLQPRLVFSLRTLCDTHS